MYPAPLFNAPGGVAGGAAFNPNAVANFLFSSSIASAPAQQLLLLPQNRAPTVQLHGLMLLATLAEKKPQWLTTNREVLDVIRM